LKQYLLDTNICIYLLKGLYNLAGQIEKTGIENCFLRPAKRPRLPK